MSSLIKADAGAAGAAADPAVVKAERIQKLLEEGGPDGKKFRPHECKGNHVSIDRFF